MARKRTHPSPGDGPGDGPGEHGDPALADALDDLGRYAGPATLILASLAAGPKHGYALTGDIERFAAMRLGPGTMYGALSRLEERGLIAPVASDDRRRPYRLTERGAIALRHQLEAQRDVADLGLRRLAAHWRPA